MTVTLFYEANCVRNSLKDGRTVLKSTRQRYRENKHSNTSLANLSPQGPWEHA